MEKRFKDRKDAGQQLALKLKFLSGEPDLIVLGLPRGGVPVADKVATVLKAPLDVFVVRKLGAPHQEELAIGALASGGLRHFNEDIIHQLHLTKSQIDEVIQRESQRLADKERQYRSQRSAETLQHRTIVLVDDGLATGATMIAALKTIRQLSPKKVIVAVPVTSKSAKEAVARYANAVITIVCSDDFFSVGQWYEDFTATTDEEVAQLLKQAPPHPVSEVQTSVPITKAENHGPEEVKPPGRIVIDSYPPLE